jgi:FkbM family methyltransferase
VFDIGAHQCVVAMVLAHKVGPGGSVVALEANGHNARMGALNRDLNDLPQLRVLHAAGAARSGPITIIDGYNAQANPEGQGVVVEGYSVDDLSSIYGPPDVLFVDVEGFEGQVLAGASKTLSRRPDCCVEVHVNGGLEQFGETAQSIIERFPERDYDRYIAGESARVEGATGRIFAPYAAGSPALQERFHLLALARG